MSQPPTNPEPLQDTPTHRYNLMEMRVDQIQGLVTLLQQRRIAIQETEKKIRNNKKISTAKDKDLELKKLLDKLEKLIPKITKDVESAEKLLNSSRGLIFELTDGDLTLEKLNGNAQSENNLRKAKGQDSTGTTGSPNVAS